MKRIPNYQRIYDMALEKFKAEGMWVGIESELLNIKRYGFVLTFDDDGDEDNYDWDAITDSKRYPKCMRFLSEFIIKADLATWEHCEEINEDGNYTLLHKLGHDVERGGTIDVDSSFSCDLALEEFGSVEECFINCDMRGVRGEERNLLGFLTWLSLQKREAANKGK